MSHAQDADADSAAPRSRPVRRPELLVRLHALADDARLRMLEQLAHQGELSAQELLATSEISQATASRHLGQLRVAGFVRERRGGGATKLYTLVPGQVEETLRLVQQLLDSGLPEAAPPPESGPAHVPVAIRRFFSPDGRLVRWPGKLKEREQAMEIVARDFVPGRVYSEREVNDLLRRHAANDVANLRRLLCDLGQLQRERSGARYWRGTGRPQPERGGGADPG